MIYTFTEELLVESYGDKWISRRAFHFYRIDEFGAQKDVIVPEGFITDFASTPKFLYPWFPPIGIYNKAAMVHDYLYSTAILPRKEADLFFLQAMEVLQVPKWKRKMMFWAVRCFGAKKFGII